MSGLLGAWLVATSIRCWWRLPEINRCLNYKEIQPQETECAQLPAPEKLQTARLRARQWLARHGGNPYQTTVMDLDGKVGIQYGVYGVPETYLIDRQGVIRFKHVGAVTPALLNKTLLPLIKQLEGA